MNESQAIQSAIDWFKQQYHIQPSNVHITTEYVSDMQFPDRIAYLTGLDGDVNDDDGEDEEIEICLNREDELVQVTVTDRNDDITVRKHKKVKPCPDCK